MGEEQTEDPRPPHLSALRILILAPCGGVLGALGMALGRALNDQSFRPTNTLLFAVMTGAFCALLITSEEVARRVRRSRQLLILLVTGCLAALVATCAVMWVEGFLRGGPEKAWLRLTRVPAGIARDPKVSFAFLLGALAPFALLGTIRLRLLGQGSWYAQVVAGVVGMMATLGIFMSVDIIRLVRYRDFILFATWGAAIGLGLAWGQWLEAKLLGWWRAKSDAP